MPPLLLAACQVVKLFVITLSQMICDMACIFFAAFNRKSFYAEPANFFLIVIALIAFNSVAAQSMDSLPQGMNPFGVTSADFSDSLYRKSATVLASDGLFTSQRASGEMADAPDLGSGSARSGGSSPS